MDVNGIPSMSQDSINYALAHNVERKAPRWAICGKCHKFHKEGSKIQIAHVEYMGQSIRWTETDPNSAYRGKSY